MARVASLAWVGSVVVLPLVGCGAPEPSPLEARASALMSPPVLGLADSVIETLYESESNPCGIQNVHVDSPVRIYEDVNHRHHLMFSDGGARGWQLTGSNVAFTQSPPTPKLDCTSVMTGNVGDDLQSSFNQKTWIEGLHYQPSTNTVYAYGHEDFWGGPPRIDDPLCHASGVDDGKPSCWYAAITVWKAASPTAGSTQTHVTFSRSAAVPDHVAVYPPVRYPLPRPTTTSGWIGYGTPSNLLRGRTQTGALDGYVYMFVTANNTTGGQATGNCLFRSSNPASPSSWRAWNGSTSSPAFEQVSVNPYTGTNPPCAVVDPANLPTTVRSVAWHKPSRHYVALYRRGDGIQYVTSPDLLHWSAPATLLVSTAEQASYPSLIDHDGGDYGDDNFDRLYFHTNTSAPNGNTFLYYRKNPADGVTRLVRRRLKVLNYGPDVPGSSNPG